MYYGLVSIAVLLQAINFGFSKLYQSKAGSSYKRGLESSLLSSIATIIIFSMLNRFKFEFSVFSMLMGLGKNVCCILYAILGLKVMERGKVAYYTMFLMTGGMSIPYVWGLIFLNEPFSIIRSVGLVIIILSVIIINFDKNKIDIKTLLLCIAIFILNGFVSVFSKMHQIGDEAISSQGFIVLSAIESIVVCLPIWLVIKNKTFPEDKSPSFKSIVLIIAASSLIGGVSYLFQLIGASHLPATVLYPMFTGGTIIFTSIVAWIAFHEKPNRSLIIGMIICFIGTLMFL